LNERIVTDELWRAVAPLLPGKVGDPGCSARDNRLFLEAVFWVARSGEPWRALPPEFGKWYTVYTRFRRWHRKGVWRPVVAVLQSVGARELLYGREGLYRRERARPRKPGSRRDRPATGPEGEALLRLRLGLGDCGRDAHGDLHRLP
jgi:transposase